MFFQCDLERREVSAEEGQLLKESVDITTECIACGIIMVKLVGMSNYPVFLHKQLNLTVLSFFLFLLRRRSY